MNNNKPALKFADYSLQNTQTKLGSELLSRKEAAAYLGVSVQTLAIWRSTGRYNLKMIKMGRLAKYRRSDLDEFINRREAA